jgi:hypothetical protein
MSRLPTHTTIPGRDDHDLGSIDVDAEAGVDRSSVYDVGDAPYPHGGNAMQCHGTAFYCRVTAAGDRMGMTA